MANRSATNAAGSGGSAGDRTIILVQLGLGVGLVVFGALLLVIFKATDVFGTANSDLTTIGGNIATGVLGVGAALLPAGAASAASSRILASLPSQPATQAPVVTGITATPGPHGGTSIKGNVVTSDDGFWFVQYGSQSGDYQKTQVGGLLTAKPGDQEIETPAPIADLATGNFVRIGFTTNNTGQTTYSKEIRVL